MKKSIYAYALLLLSLTSCTVTTLQAPGEITTADVNLPFDGATAATMKYMPCYVNTEARIHAADVFYFNDFSSDETIRIVAPVGGLVMYIDRDPNTIDIIGQFIVIKTDFVFQKERVYYLLTQFHNMASEISVGKRIKQGDTIGYIDHDGPSFDPLNGYILNIAFFVAKPYLYDNDATGNGADIEKYIDPGPLLGDNLEKFPLIYHMPRCAGDPVINQ